MTDAERERDMDRARLYAAMEDGCIITAGRLPFLARKFPIPNTDGMTPEERDATLARWRDEIRAFRAEMDAPGALAQPARAPVPQAAPVPPEVPAS